MFIPFNHVPVSLLLIWEKWYGTLLKYSKNFSYKFQNDAGWEVSSTFDINQKIMNGFNIVWSNIFKICREVKYANKLCI